ncbi:hypothetical protein [Microbacterium sp. SSM24]|uniref:hypothetical protein n=1 Tax=Microbacterium sp. SSM24 TaxID=2991714 RepID=UPI002226FF9A|nr:hypothetical protein [Microbacterium sp. SSM24]MCW3492886.1 hypothetical protein [Microbacterium sp. SSM24]
MMHSTATTALSRGRAPRASAVGAALLAIAGNVLVVAILGLAALVTLAAAVLVFGGGLADLV